MEKTKEEQIFEAGRKLGFAEGSRKGFEKAAKIFVILATLQTIVFILL